METEPRMEPELFHRVLLYRTTMASFKKMLTDGTITEEEYAALDQKMAEKYGLGDSVIYR